MDSKWDAEPVIKKYGVEAIANEQFLPPFVIYSKEHESYIATLFSSSIEGLGHKNDLFVKLEFDNYITILEKLDQSPKEYKAIIFRPNGQIRADSKDEHENLKAELLCFIKSLKPNDEMSKVVFNFCKKYYKDPAFTQDRN